MANLSDHPKYNKFLEREYLVRKQTPNVELDGSITTTPILIAVPEARDCPNKTCDWFRNVPYGGRPCDRCRHFIKGDFST